MLVMAPWSLLELSCLTDVSQFPFSSQVIAVRSNTYFLSLLEQNPYHRDKLHALFPDGDIFGPVSRYLFRPVPEVARRMALFQHALQRDDRPDRDDPDPVLGIHLRVGMESGEHFQETQYGQAQLPTHLQTVLHCAKGVLRELGSEYRNVAGIETRLSFSSRSLSSLVTPYFCVRSGSIRSWGRFADEAATHLRN